MSARVTLDHVSKSFGDVPVVRDLCLEVEEGEFLVLVGPSGCGKTTVLRIVAGLDEPTGGTIRIADEVVNGQEPRDRDIAMVFQSYALYPHMSVFDNLAFGLRQRKLSSTEINDRVAEAAGMLGLQELLQRKPRQLSGGQRQRVALGRAIVRRPNVFLMDEPLSNLDAHLRLRTRAEIVGLQRQLATTAIYVTHDQVEAMTMGSRIAVLNDGILQQVDTPQRVYDFPANAFVAQFIGSPSMNLLAGELVADGEGLAFAGPDWHLPMPASALLQGPATNSLMLGLRPEHLRLAETGETAATLTGRVTTIEPLGSDLFVMVDIGAGIVARLAPHAAIEVGSRVSLVPDLERAHLFATDGGMRIR